jgi:F-type H+-transporting ATPase subunit delta
MSNNITIARPYARAVFLLAKSSGLYEKWSSTLVLLKTIVKNSKVTSVLKDPTVGTALKANLIINIAGKHLNPYGKNLVKALAKYRRLLYLSELYDLYEIYRAEEEKTIKVDIISAVKIDPIVRDKLVTTLSKKINKKVIVKFKIDSKLLGGAVIRAQDMVINGSVQGRLAALQNYLVSRN